MKALALAAVVAALALNHKLLFRREFSVPPSDGGAILISGTSSGIGRATCGWLAEKKPQTSLYCGIRKEKDATGYPFNLPNVKSVILDITKQEHVDSALEQIRSTGKPLIGLINNAGVSGDLMPLEFLGVERLRRVLEINVMGTYRLTQAALPMIRQSKGRILIVGSGWALFPASPLFTAYVASKCALEAMADALRMEMAPLGVSVSLFEPGFLKSEMASSESDMFKAALALGEAEEETEERLIYPHVMDGNYVRTIGEIADHPGDMEETCVAMEDAIFGKYPQTRYITSWVGPVPTWLLFKIIVLTPDRVFDWITMHFEILIGLARMRSAIEGWFLGMS